MNADEAARTPPQYGSVDGRWSEPKSVTCVGSKPVDDGSEKNLVRRVKEMSRRKGRRERREQRRQQIRQNRCNELGSIKDIFKFLDTYKQGKKCCRNVRWKQSVQQFELGLFRTTAVSCQALCMKKYKFHGYTHFYLRERGKIRPIDAPRVQDRQIEKVFTKRVLLHLYEPSMVYNNGASLEGKGFHFTQRMLVRDLQRHWRKYGRAGGIILTDARHFFPSADHEYLFQRHRRWILNEELRDFADKIVRSSPNPEGMPLGVEPSQVEMIAYPSAMDNYLSCQYRLVGGHYMDDFYYLVPPGVNPQEVIQQINEQAKRNHLTLHPDKTRYIPLTHGFRFCKIKYILTETGKVIKRANQKAMGRDRKKIKALKKKLVDHEMSHEDIWTSVNGMLAYLGNYNEHNHILQLRRYFYKLFGFSCEDIQEFRKRDEHHEVFDRKKVQASRYWRQF